MLNVFLQADPGEGSMMPTLVMFGLFFVFMYFVMLRPQMKKQKKEQNFQGSLKVGQRIVTTSGMHGRIAQVEEDGIVIETLSGKLKFEKSAVSREFTAARFPEPGDVKTK
ncbi:preprotein translocase subunit YajC [Chryseobacterium sp. A301]